MKRVLIFIFLIVLMSLITGCSEANTNPVITIEYLKENAKVGLTENEIKDKFGQEVYKAYVDGSDVWIFDKTKKDFKYTLDGQHVAIEEIKNGNVQYQLYINVIKNKAIMFSYFHKGENNEVWEVVIDPNGIQKEKQVSNSFK